MQIINTSNLNEARKQIQNLKKEKDKKAQEIVVKAQDNKFNRKILENKDVDMVVGLELHDRKDKLKQRDSGLNEVLCKLATKNNIKIGIDLEKLKNQDKKNKAIILSRIAQNIDLCKRTNTELKLIGKYDEKQAFSFLLSLGASTSQAKKAINLA